MAPYVAIAASHEPTLVESSGRVADSSRLGRFSLQDAADQSVRKMEHIGRVRSPPGMRHIRWCERDEPVRNPKTFP